MLRDRIEGKWIDAFAHTFRLCEVQPGEIVAILSETQSRQINVHLAELALQAIGARPFHIVMPTPRLEAPVAVRSTGSSHAIQQLEPAVAALSSVTFIVDCTVEGVMHAPETPGILKSGARILYISNEHPELLERLKPDAALFPKIQRAREMLSEADEMRVTSVAGSDLTISLKGIRVGGNFGVARQPGQLATWPGGTCSSFPAPHSTNGVLVLAEGDVNLTFKRYLESPVRLVIEDDFVTRVEGDSFDGDLMRSYFEAWNDPNAYGVSHIGWGMNPAARWDSLIMYDKGDVNGTELRAYAGNFLFSTGANPSAGRHTLGHYDLPVGKCTITLDGVVAVKDGQLQGELA